MANIEKFTFKGDLVNNQYLLSEEPDGEWCKYSPADLKDTVIKPSYYLENIDKACEAAKAAFYQWSSLPLSERKTYLLKLRDIYIEHEVLMAELIARETGKPLWEATTEAKALSGKINITLEHSLALIEEQKVKAALPGVDGYIRYKPKGVMAVLGPFNFPGHLPNGHIVPALITGNTVVFKPSDKTPAVGQFMADMFVKAGFPKGVFNLLQGQVETGKRLANHQLVDAVLFTGSYNVGLKIKQDTLNQHWKTLALEMGGKNSSIVWEDADLEKAVYECIIGSYITTGQRCSGTSRIILHKKIKEKFLSNFYETAKKLTIGHWRDNPFMGSLISEDSVENYIRFQEIAKREGCESLMRGKALELNHKGYYVTPSITLVDKVDAKSVYQKSEIFGPNVAIFETDDFDEAMSITNNTGFGLAMSVFSKNKKLYEQSLLDAKVGLVNWNRTTNGASSRLPFGGVGKSGNERPSAHFAVYYCTTPVSSLEDETQLNKNKLLPGIDYNFR